MTSSLNVMSGGTIMIEDVDCDVNTNVDWKAISGTNTTIVDDAITTIDFEIGNEAPGTLSELAVRLHIEHEDVSQLIITLQSPDEKNIKLWNQYCATENSIDFYVSETGTIAPICSDLYNSGGRYYSPGQIPENSFSNLYNSSSVGTWQIIIEDTQPGENGHVNEVFLYLR